MEIITTQIAELDQFKNIALGDRTDKWTISISGTNIHPYGGNQLDRHFRAATFNLNDIAKALEELAGLRQYSNSEATIMTSIRG